MYISTARLYDSTRHVVRIEKSAHKSLFDNALRQAKVVVVLCNADVEQKRCF